METTTDDRPEWVHISVETALWLNEELTEQWKMSVLDDLHNGYHLLRALIELRSELGLDFD